jgi:hypothetical protein
MNERRFSFNPYSDSSESKIGEEEQISVQAAQLAQADVTNIMNAL